MSAQPPPKPPSNSGSGATPKPAVAGTSATPNPAAARSISGSAATPVTSGSAKPATPTTTGKPKTPGTVAGKLPDNTGKQGKKLRRRKGRKFDLVDRVSQATQTSREFAQKVINSRFIFMNMVQRISSTGGKGRKRRGKKKQGQAGPASATHPPVAK